MAQLLGASSASGSPHRCHPTGVTPGWSGQLGELWCQSCDVATRARLWNPASPRAQGNQEGKQSHPILIMTFEALPNYIVSLKTTTQIFMSGTFNSHCNQ